MRSPVVRSIVDARARKARGSDQVAAPSGFRRQWCLLQLVRHHQFLDRDAIAPEAHESLFGRVAKGRGAVLAVEGGVAQGIERLPMAVVVQGVDPRRPATAPFAAGGEMIQDQGRFAVTITQDFDEVLVGRRQGRLLEDQIGGPRLLIGKCFFATGRRLNTEAW